MVTVFALGVAAALVAARLWLSRQPTASGTDVRPSPGATGSDRPSPPGGSAHGQISVRYIETGLALEAEGKDREAAILYRTAIEIDSAFAMAHLTRLLGLGDRGDLDHVAAEFSDSIPTNADAARRHHEVSAALGDGRLDRAAGLYNDAHDTNPAYAKALLSLWAALEERGLLDKAALRLAADLASSPGSADTHRTLAAVMYARGLYTQAWREVQLCKQHGGTLDPGFLDALRDKRPAPAP